jgi:hypothetical protein
LVDWLVCFLVWLGIAEGKEAIEATVVGWVLRSLLFSGGGVQGEAEVSHLAPPIFDVLHVLHLEMFPSQVTCCSWNAMFSPFSSAFET